MFLPEVEGFESKGRYGATIGAMREMGMPPPQIMHLFAFREEKTSHLSHFTQRVMRGESGLSAGQREMIAALTSSQNQCLF